jgi:CheY-like chemotaxis protein
VNLEGVQVLAVDDDPDTRNLLKRILQEHSADVLTAASAEEALTLLEEHQPHIVLSDIGMPEMDGYDFLRRLRQSGNQIPAVAVTAFARSEDRTKALIAGYHGHVTKPVEPNELVATVAAFAKTFPRRGHQSD